MGRTVPVGMINHGVIPVVHPRLLFVYRPQVGLAVPKRFNDYLRIVPQLAHRAFVRAAAQPRSPQHVTARPRKIARFVTFLSLQIRSKQFKVFVTKGLAILARAFARVRKR